MNDRDAHASAAGRFIPQSLLEQSIRSDALFFPHQTKACSTPLVDGGFTNKQMARETEREGVRFPPAFHSHCSQLCWKKLHQNSQDRAELLSQNETSAEEGGSVCLLLHSAWEIDSVPTSFAQKCPSWCSGWTENQFAAHCTDERGVVPRFGWLSVQHWQTALWEFNDGYEMMKRSTKEKHISFLKAGEVKHSLEALNRWCQPRRISTCCRVINSLFKGGEINKDIGWPELKQWHH